MDSFPMYKRCKEAQWHTFSKREQDRATSSWAEGFIPETDYVHHGFDAWLWSVEREDAQILVLIGIKQG